MNPKANATLVDALGSCLRRGDHALGTVPELLKRVLSEDAWREFETQRGELVRYERFADFVVTAPLKGLGASVDLVRRIVADDPQTLDLLDRALQNPVGTNVALDNIQSQAPTGTSKDAALRRLRKDAPEVHARVVAGELSPHAGMVLAGLRPQSFTVRVTEPADIAATLRRRLPPDVLAAVLSELSEGEPAT